MAEEKKIEKTEVPHEKGHQSVPQVKDGVHIVPNREGGHRDEKREEKRDDKSKTGYSFPQAFRAQVEEMVGRTGMRGEAVQVRCKILDGRDSGKVMRRNVKGPVRIGDILMLRETEIEAQKLKGGCRR